MADGDSPSFATLFDRAEGEQSPSGRLRRGNSALLAALADPSETYAEVLETVTAEARSWGGETAWA